MAGPEGDLSTNVTGSPASSQRTAEASGAFEPTRRSSLRGSHRDDPRARPGQSRQAISRFCFVATGELDRQLLLVGSLEPKQQCACDLNLVATAAVLRGCAELDHRRARSRLKGGATAGPLSLSGRASRRAGVMGRHGADRPPSAWAWPSVRLRFRLLEMTALLLSASNACFCSAAVPGRAGRRPLEQYCALAGVLGERGGAVELRPSLVVAAELRE